MASEVSEYLGMFVQVLDVLERHPVVTICLAVLIVTIGTPEIGPADKPWVRARSGVGWIAVKLVDAYVEKVQVFKRLEAQVESFGEKMVTLSERVGESEKVVAWQTQVVLAIASVLKIDVLTLLGKTNSPIVPLARESVTEVVGKKSEKHAEAPVVPS
jgi:hypothetical protein